MMAELYCLVDLSRCVLAQTWGWDVVQSPWRAIWPVRRNDYPLPFADYMYMKGIKMWNLLETCLTSTVSCCICVSGIEKAKSR